MLRSVRRLILSSGSSPTVGDLTRHDHGAFLAVLLRCFLFGVSDVGDRRMESMVVEITTLRLTNGVRGRGRAVARMYRPCGAAMSAVRCRADALDRDMTCGDERVLLCVLVVSYCVTVLCTHVVTGVKVMPPLNDLCLFFDAARQDGAGKRREGYGAYMEGGGGRTTGATRERKVEGGSGGRKRGLRGYM